MNPVLDLIVVEDHDALREMMVAALALAGHRVLGFDSAESMIEGLGTMPLDVALLDLNLPGEDGLSLARRLRALQPEIGILMLTARSEVADRVTGYEHGADIYLPKPVATDELLAAVAALGRRLRSTTVEAPFRLDLAHHRLIGPVDEVHLAEAEVTLLRTFATTPAGRLETWQIQALLGITTDNRGALEVRLSRLRKKLEIVGARGDILRAVRGYGYQLGLSLLAG